MGIVKNLTIPVIIISKEYVSVQKCYSIVNDEIISIKHIQNTLFALI